MLYRIAKGGVPTYTDGQDPLIYLVTTVQAVAATGTACLFSDGNCASAITQVFDDLTLLESTVDWDVMRATMWNNTADDPDRKRRRAAEFLVHKQVPITCLAEIAVRSTVIEQRVESILAAHQVALPVRVRASWYFS
jgi:hypothetical protein